MSHPFKTIILAGGLGTRLSEETDLKPKPMVDIGDRPILWHIMNIYSAYGHNNFYIALGYKGEQIKQYFINYNTLANDIRVDLKNETLDYINKASNSWSINLIETGKTTETGGRILRLQDFIGNETFLLTYGDGVADIDINKLIQFHKSHGKLATITAVRPPSRFGRLEFDGSTVTSFSEKPQIGEGWINGGFFVLEPAVFQYIKDDSTIFEREPLEQLAQDGQLQAYKHEGFWQCMDTKRDRDQLENLFKKGVPWLHK